VLPVYTSILKNISKTDLTAIVSPLGIHLCKTPISRSALAAVEWGKKRMICLIFLKNKHLVVYFSRTDQPSLHP